MGEEAPTVNGQAESSTDSVDREPELEPAEEATENGPTGGSASREPESGIILPFDAFAYYYNTFIMQI